VFHPFRVFVTYFFELAVMSAFFNVSVVESSKIISRVSFKNRLQILWMSVLLFTEVSAFVSGPDSVSGLSLKLGIIVSSCQKHRSLTLHGPSFHWSPFIRCFVYKINK
jgi:hypothetical protein